MRNRFINILFYMKRIILSLQTTQGQCRVKNSSRPLNDDCDIQKAPVYKDLVFYLSKISKRTMVRLYVLYYTPTHVSQITSISYTWLLFLCPKVLCSSGRSLHDYPVQLGKPGHKQRNHHQYWTGAQPWCSSDQPCKDNAHAAVHKTGM